MIFYIIFIINLIFSAYFLMFIPYHIVVKGIMDYVQLELILIKNNVITSCKMDVNIIKLEYLYNKYLKNY